MKPLECKDYEIDILIGKLAAILVIVKHFSLVWKAISEKDVLFSTVFFVLFILIPCLYLFFLKIYNLKFAKLTFQVWFFCISLLCLSITNDVLNKFSGFWRTVFPVAFVTVCMLIGLTGVIRIKNPNQVKRYMENIKISESHYNLLILIYSITYIIGLVSVFTFMVLIGKYFHDFVLINWPSLEKNRILLFYIGMAIGYYPSKYLGAAISAVFTVSVNRIYKRCVKPQT